MSQIDSSRRQDRRSQAPRLLPQAPRLLPQAPRLRHRRRGVAGLAPAGLVAVGFAALLCFSAAGCSNLPALAANTCGNRVLDPGEDCDGASAFGAGSACAAPGGANACHYVCGASGATCPSGWGCGADGRCRRPSGKFTMAPGSPWSFPARKFVLGDVDGDGVLDLVGEQNDTISVRFGDLTDGTLSFPLLHSTVTRQPSGPVSFGLFNNDHRLDAVIPTAGGLFVLLGDASRTFEPVAYSSVKLPYQDSLRAVAIPDQVAGDTDTHILFVHPDKQLNVWKAWFKGTKNVTPLSSDSTLELAGSIPVGNLGGDPTRNEFAVGFVGQTDVKIYTSQGSLSAGSIKPVAYANDPDVSLPGSLLAPGVHFADVDGDGDLDLLAVVDAGSGPEAAVALNSGGIFAQASIEHDFDGLFANDGPLLLATDINGDGVADYVTAKRVVTAKATVASGAPSISFDCVPPGSSPCEPALTSPGTWKEAVAGDFNGDGRVDIATALKNREGVDIYYGTGGQLFNQRHIDTDASPHFLRVGDFDGDFVDDLAFVEPTVGGPDSLEVVFGGASGGPSAPIEMGKLGHVDSVATAIAGTTNPATRDAIDDLAVVSSTHDLRTLAILRGSGSRRMLSPFVLKTSVNAPGDVPNAAVFGEFSPKPDGIPDILAAATANDGTERVWLIQGTDGSGGLDASGAGWRELADPASFALSCATWAVGDIDAPGVEPRDELAGVDFADSCSGDGGYQTPQLLVTRVEDKPASPLSLSTGMLPSGLVAPIDSHLVDLNNDGYRDLLVLFGGDSASCSGSAPAKDSAVAVLWNRKGTISASSLSTVQVPSECRLHDLAPILLDDSGVPELLILGEQGIYAAKIDLNTLKFGQPRMLIPFPNEGRMQVGDLDDDGLQDIAVSNHGEVSVWLATPAPPLGGEN